jgi:2-(1,2-epoxy-1,2-dihydrophenyl)acetyl-CoA isomerase
VADDKLLNEAGALAAELAQGPHSLKLIRNLLWESVDAKYEEQLNNERQAQRTAGRTEDFKEGITAFNDKREAKFTGN